MEAKDAAKVIKFPQINARPKKNADKLKPYYLDSRWIMAQKDITDAVFKGYEYAPSSDGKKPKEAWYKVPEQGFVIIAGKAKQTFIFRTAPIAQGSTYTPASALFKVKPANYGKAPKYKIKAVKDSADKTKKYGVIALKKGDAYKVTGDYTTLTDKAVFKVSELLEKGSGLYVKKAATGKKPPSEVQELKLVEVSESGGGGGNEVTTYTVYFRENGGSGSMTSATVNKGANHTLPDCTFTPPAGKVFKGWATNPSGAVITGNAIKVSANTFLYAIWESDGLDDFRTLALTLPVVGATTAKKPDDQGSFTINKWEWALPVTSADGKYGRGENKLVIGLTAKGGYIFDKTLNYKTLFPEKSIVYNADNSAALTSVSVSVSVTADGKTMTITATYLMREEVTTLEGIIFEWKAADDYLPTNGAPVTDCLNITGTDIIQLRETELYTWNDIEICKIAALYFALPEGYVFNITGGMAAAVSKIVSTDVSKHIVGFNLYSNHYAYGNEACVVIMYNSAYIPEEDSDEQSDEQG